MEVELHVGGEVGGRGDGGGRTRGGGGREKARLRGFGVRWSRIFGYFYTTLV